MLFWKGLINCCDGFCYQQHFARSKEDVCYEFSSFEEDDFVLSYLYSQEQLSLDSRLESLCQSFISHNLSTGNFGSLINIYLVKVSELLALSDAER